MQMHLERLSNGSLQPISREERNKVDDDLKKWARIETKRRDIFHEIWSCVAEGVADKKVESELRERLDLEEVD